MISHYGYLGLAALILVESFGIPAPGEGYAIAAVVAVGGGYLLWRRARRRGEAVTP